MRLIGSDFSFMGELGIIYSSEETGFLAARLKFMLVGKFSHGLPNLNFLRLRIVKLGLKGNVTVGRLKFKHVLIRLINDEDLSRLWLRAHLFEKNALFTLAAKIGKPLRIDEPMADMSRPDLARVCVEINLTAPKVQAVFLHIEGKTYRQQVIYENCPPYCTSCNHLGHDISACIAKHHNGLSHTDTEPRPPGNTRYSREIINNRRKGKVVAIANTHVTLSVEHNIDKYASFDLPSSTNVNGANANDVSSPPLHVSETEPPVELIPHRPGQMEVATLDDFNYEDALIAELLDKDWDAKNKCQNAPHFLNIEAVEGRDKESSQDTVPSVVPNSLPEETSPKPTGTTRNFFRGETSRQRCLGDQPQEYHSLEAHLAPVDSEGEEESTPISNHFQSLEDMETEDILHIIESTQTTSPSKDKKTGRCDVDVRIYCNCENTLPMEHPIQEGGVSQQEIIFTDSTASSKHKRNKRYEDAMIKSPKTGCKVSSDILPMDIFCTFVYAKMQQEPEESTVRGTCQEWAELYNITRVIHLPRRFSDHRPLCIEASKIENKKSSSFRVQNMWLLHHSFLQTVKQSWELLIEGYGMYKLQQKIYRTKELLRQWNRDTFCNVFTSVQQAKQDATDAEKKFNRDPSEDNLMALNKSNAVLVHALSFEAEFWKQKSNCKWLDAGEKGIHNSFTLL
ncbi:UNVERIFIED_CONTAM: hypothetical protein Slati_3450100 [Sesamum latifolium]|uniref:DUF4283 domain-containing protein n=1 Tax=Sesamum latifolium TaxID=2727402 RepID=A0AAW2UHP5_9LAMI